MFKITKEQALEIQDKQLAYYESTFPGITAKIKAKTTADQLEPDTLYDMVTINKHVPRGGAIEAMLNIRDMGGRVMTATIWQFKTHNFTVAYEVEPEYDLDLSWDEDGSVREGLERGQFIAFVAKVAVYYKGIELGSSYLGGCIYESVDEFRDHIGSKAKGYGSYFSDMVREAIAEARRTISVFPHIRRVSQ